MKKLLAMVLVLAGLSAILFACEKAELEEPTTTGTTESLNEPENQTSEDRETYEQWLQRHKGPLPIDDNYSYWDPRMPHLMAQDAENEAYLYGFNNATFGGSGALLLYKGSPCYLDWDYYVLQYSYPDMKVADFDGDGKPEIALNILTGKGVGWSPERLIVVVPKPPVAEHIHFDVYYFDPNDMRKQIDAVITVEEIHSEDGILVRVSDGKKTVTEPAYAMASFEEHVRFSFEDDRIHMRAFASNNGNVTADVQFKNGMFTLKNIALHELEEDN